MHQAWKAKEKRSSRRVGGRTTALRRFNHSWHCSKVENWHLMDQSQDTGLYSVCVVCPVCTLLFSFTVQHNVAALFSCHLFIVFTWHYTLGGQNNTCPPPASLETDEEKSRGCIFIYSVKYWQTRKKEVVDQCYQAQLGPWRESLLHARNTTSLKLTTQLH